MLEKLVRCSGDSETRIRVCVTCSPHPASPNPGGPPLKKSSIPLHRRDFSYHLENVGANADKDALPHIVYRDKNNGEIGPAETSARVSMDCHVVEGVTFAVANIGNWNCCNISVLIPKFRTQRRSY